LGSLESRIATPLSLVVTELIHNALEHGLAESGTQLRIELQRYSNGRTEIGIYTTGNTSKAALPTLDLVLLLH
ncbi:MAG: hypothetical protein RL066_472, partial [Actinomycetota bacterium]